MTAKEPGGPGVRVLPECGEPSHERPGQHDLDAGDRAAVRRHRRQFEHDAPDVTTTLALIAALAVQVAPAAAHAGITRIVSGAMRSIGATSSVVEQVDALQYGLGSGPCVHAAIENNIYIANDLAADPRWPNSGRRAAAEHGVRSMVSYRIYLEQDPVVAALAPSR